MLVSELDDYFRSILDIDELRGVDASLNGVQVGDLSAEVRHIAFAVDAALETLRRARDCGADMLFVHHGLFWGRDIPVTGAHYERLKILLESRIALYAAHLPLDKHIELGNNAQMAKALRLSDIQPFGEYKGVEIGVKGVLPEPTTTRRVAETLFSSSEAALGVLPFGPEKSRTVSIVSGGAPSEVDQAISEGSDLFITGDASHTIYHRCLEAGINVIFGGHYQTETWGPRAMMERTAADTGVETTFIELPTGL
jgi:dinuclear metal center YbgI/SA1388 family protein